MDKVKILYNGKDAFDPQPTPFVGLEENNIYYGELWAKEETTTLEGQLTGCTFDDIVIAQKQLIENFKKNYQNLEIWQEENSISGKIFQKDLVEIQSINFPSDRWIGVLPYTISLKCYPSGYFSGANGILAPNDTWNIAENENYSATIIHTLSCRGLNTSNIANNAIENARIWVSGKRNVNSFISPALIENIFTGNVCLLTSEEEIDRFNGTYSIVDTYRVDQTRTGYGLVRYSTDFDSGSNGISVSFQGSIEGCEQNLTEIRNQFNLLDKYWCASKSYQRIFNRNDLNPTPLSYSVEEDTYNTTINFSYLYDNDNSPEVVFDYTVSLSSGDAIGASIQGNVISRGGDIKSKLEKAKIYAGTLNLYNLTVPFYNDFYPYAIQYPLNPRPLSSGITVNQFDGSIALNAQFGNQEQVSFVLDSFNYSLSFVPSIIKINSAPKLNGQGIYSNVDLGYTNRASLSINGNATINANYSSSEGVAVLSQKVNSLISQYGRLTNLALDSKNISISRIDKKLVQFSFSWSFDSPNVVSQNYSGINTFLV